jgi:hypothetical protein
LSFLLVIEDTLWSCSLLTTRSVNSFSLIIGQV